MRISDWSSDVCSSDLGRDSAQPDHRHGDGLKESDMPQICNVRHSAIIIQRLLACVLCCAALSACGSMNSMLGGSSEEDALKDMKWSYADDGLQIDLQADPALNQFAGQPHMLTLVIVQMEAPNAFTEQTANAARSE